jgi:1-deoxy-D-xylulose-5-phosphate synthase
VAIYSTFLQRGYDQLIHDVTLQNLPMVFAIDRAGMVGADGATHAGSFDIAYMACLPNMVIMAPSDEAELVHTVATSVAVDDRPVAFRYPRGEGTGIALPTKGEVLALGKGRIMREGNNIAILSLGTRLADAMKAADELAARGFPTTVADARFAKPIDTALVEQLARHHAVLITIEEASIGGFATQVMHHLAWKGLLDKGLKFRPMVMPDVFIDHDSQARQLVQAGLSARDIVNTALAAVGIEAPDSESAKVLTSR